MTKILFIIGLVLILAAVGLFIWSDHTAYTPAGSQLGLNLELASKITIAAGIVCWAVAFVIGGGDSKK